MNTIEHYFHGETARTLLLDDDGDNASARPVPGRRKSLKLVGSGSLTLFKAKGPWTPCAESSVEGPGPEIWGPAWS